MGAVLGRALSRTVGQRRRVHAPGLDQELQRVRQRVQEPGPGVHHRALLVLAAEPEGERRAL